MEHRCSSRVVTELKLLIFRRGLPVATGKVRNASNHGIFVETDFQDVGVHQPLEVEFDLRAAVPAPDACRFRAVVARMGERGLGLELDGGNAGCEQAFRVLVDELRSAGPSHRLAPA